MDAKNVFATLLLCLLGLSALTSSLPAPLQENHQPLKKVVRRSSDPQEVGNTHSSPSYFVDLYRNLSDSTLHTQANTIRSLQYIATPGSDCNTFNFSLSALYNNNTEFILDSTEIRLFYPLVKLPESHANVPYRVEISARLSDGSFYTPVMGDREVSFSRGFSAFPMGGIVRKLVSLGEPFANITLKVYKIEDISSKKTSAPCDTSFFHFSNREYNMDTIPMLIVYSYDPVVTTVGRSFTGGQQQDAADVGTADARQRRKRSDTNRPTCQVNSLVLNESHYEASLLKVPEGFEVVMPTTFNIGICGGRCSNAVFPSSKIRHPSYLHELIEKHENVRQALSNPGTTRCCVPSEYKSLSVLVLTEGDALIKLIDNLVVSKCHCIDVLDI